MDIEKTKDEIVLSTVEKVKAWFKSEKETEAAKLKDEGKEVPVNFMLEQADIDTVNQMIAEAMQPLVEEIATLKGEATTASDSAEEMGKELATVKAAKEDLETKLAAQTIAEPTKVVPSKQDKSIVFNSDKMSKKARLTEFLNTLN